MNGGSRCWASLPADALAYIINECGLAQSDVSAIRLVCVHWRTTTNSHLKSLAPACTSLEQVAGIALRFPYLTNCDMTRCDTRLVGHASLCRDASARLSTLLAALARMPSLTSLHISDTFSERMGQKHWASLVCAQALIDVSQPQPEPVAAGPVAAAQPIPPASTSLAASPAPATAPSISSPLHAHDETQHGHLENGLVAEGQLGLAIPQDPQLPSEPPVHVASPGTVPLDLGAEACLGQFDDVSNGTAAVLGSRTAALMLAATVRIPGPGAEVLQGAASPRSLSPVVSLSPELPAPSAADSNGECSSAAEERVPFADSRDWVSTGPETAVQAAVDDDESTSSTRAGSGIDGGGPVEEPAAAEAEASVLTTAVTAPEQGEAAGGAEAGLSVVASQQLAAAVAVEAAPEPAAQGTAATVLKFSNGCATSPEGAPSPPSPVSALSPPSSSASPHTSTEATEVVTASTSAASTSIAGAAAAAALPPPPLVLTAAELTDPGIKSFARAISRPGATHQHAFWLPDWCGHLAGLQELHVRGRQRPSAGLPPCLLWLHAGRTAAQLTSLSLVRLSLATLPEQLQHLTGLTRLVAQDCSLSVMPRGLASGLSRLQYMDLSLNGLTALPSDFTQLTSLRHLDLQRNKLAALPPDVGRLSGVTALLLNNNQLRQLPPSLACMRCVEVLSCSYNWLGGMGPSLPLLCSLPKLRKLELACVSDVRCRLVPPQELRLLAAHLTHLDLAANNLVPADVLGTLTSLRGLVLSDCGLLAVPPWVRRLAPCLQHLDLSNNSLSELPPWLSACTRLRYLSIAHNRLSIRVPPSVLEQMPQLEVVESE